MERQTYRYAALRHLWRGQWRNIGVVVHSAESGFFQVRALDRGRLMKRLWDVPGEEIERVEATLARMGEAGARQARRGGLLTAWAARRERVDLGPLHVATAQHLPWAVERHFLDYAHPQIQNIG